jgi:hypothetical protein
MEYLEQGLKAVRLFQPMSPPLISTLVSKTKVPAFEGKYELFKTTVALRFNG